MWFRNGIKRCSSNLLAFLAIFLGDFFQVVHKGRDSLKCLLSAPVLVAWDIADNANTQQLVFGSILELLPLLGEVSTITRIIYLKV